MCKENNVIFRYTTYYCFEELFLTYLNIRDLLKDSEFKDEFIKVQNKILSMVNYYNSDISYWRDFFTPHNVGALKTREKLSFAICSEVFKRLPTLSKSTIGTC